MNSNQNSEIIHVSNLKKIFGNFTAVDGLSFEIYRGEIFGFLGPNGAGKTTTINMICGFSPPTEGDITILGHSIREKKQVKNLIGICPQENIFWPKLTCLEQLKFIGEMYGKTGKIAKKRSLELLEMMGLQDKSNVLASKLSGGMKRRLNICLALVHDPKILVLDEPEAGLDPQSRILVRNFIKSISKDKTIILTTHNMDEADRLADRVAIIDFGKLLKLNAPESLKKSIGKGDVLELTLETSESENYKVVIVELNKICDQVKITDNTLLLKSKDIINAISEITTILHKNRCKIKEIKFRENTLEDVFIHLTGRKLRQ